MENEKLTFWKERYSRAEQAYQSELDKMNHREDVYRGNRILSRRVLGDKKKKTPHVRNLTAELIEAQVSSSIPMPKVTARRKKDERLAEVIEAMLRNEIDRMPFEQQNDMMERTVPIQGGAGRLTEWDNRLRTHTTVGEVVVSVLHPKQIIPQEGVYTGIQDMDYIFLKLPQTKEGIRSQYGVDVRDEGEESPETRSAAAEHTDNMVTLVVTYYKNSKGGIGKYSWVNDVEIEDLEDYQARRVRRCDTCGEAEPLGPGSHKKCPKCGGTRWTDGEEGKEEIYEPIIRSDGSIIPGAHWERGEIELPEGLNVGKDVPRPHVLKLVPTKIPYYKPNTFPVQLQKNVSVYGQFLGDSDVDKIADQQNTVNRIEAKIIDKLVKAGSYMILPDTSSIRADSEEMKVVRPGTAADASMIRSIDLEGNIQQDMAYLAQVYEEARQIIGITDSFQGRRDATATSGKAKEFSANQAAGRLESKRVMKEAAYAELFEAIFKYKLAYADERRPVISHDYKGDTIYEEFNRYDFLEQDADGEWYWNDQFLFSCDTAAPLANNREAMWQETRQNFQSGAFGDPAQLETMILFWTKMEMLHYPGAADTKKYLEARQEAERAQADIAQTMPGAAPPQGTAQQLIPNQR